MTFNASALSSIEYYLDQLGEIIKLRLRYFFNGKKELAEEELKIDFDQFNGPFEKFILENQLGNEEILLLLIAIAPHIIPDFFDKIIQENIPKAGDFPSLGGIRGRQFRGFLPTGQTALFLLAGANKKKSVQIQFLLSEDHIYAKKRVLWLEETPDGEPNLSGKLVLSQEYIDLFSLGKVSRPRFSMTFPAQRLETKLEWEDLVLDDQTMGQIKDIEIWIKHHEELIKDPKIGKKLKPGYRALFHGPPGTGKTLTASLLGKYTQLDVYRVDLSMVVSKYIGETEKNLRNLFAKAESKNWILFFDEADALFGKRTNVKDAHDKYANQEVSYLLQRIEDYNGLTILASNFKSNIDDAFMRRFQSIIHFPMPKANERFRLWKQSLPHSIKLSKEVDISILAKKYAISGANILNVIQYCCLQVLGKKDPQIQISQEIIDMGLKKEFQKEGKVFH